MPLHRDQEESKATDKPTAAHSGELSICKFNEISGKDTPVYINPAHVAVVKRVEQGSAVQIFTDGGAVFVSEDLSEVLKKIGWPEQAEPEAATKSK
jgi:hypothetical protein